MKAILACDFYGGIGLNGHLPWKSLEGDLNRFKNLTQNSTVVMGYKTWVSLPKKPLPNRRNIVVSRSLTHVEGAEVISDIPSLAYIENAWFIGGADLLQHVWPCIDEFHLTQAIQAFECDAFIDLSYLHQNFNCTYQQQYTDNSYKIWLRK